MGWLADLVQWLNVDRGDLIVAVGGLAVGGYAVWLNRRSAIAAETQATTAAISAKAAQEGIQISAQSADAAKVSAAAAQDQAGAAWESARHARDSAEAANSQLQQDLRMFQEQGQPYVYADIRGDHQQAALLVIIVENLGPAIATDVSVEFDPPLQSSQIERFANVSQLKIAAMPPGRRVKYFFDSGFAYLSSGRPLVYNVRVTANGPYGPTDLAYPINLEDLKDTAAADMGNLKDIVHAIRGLDGSVGMLSTVIGATQTTHGKSRRAAGITESPMQALGLASQSEVDTRNDE
jgi:hypothetical protein